MRKEVLISVVVPIYNVEEYLSKCLNSIIAQTYKNIEIVLVNDGSPDGCGAICDKYAQKDNRIKVFHIPNGGVAKARQMGVEKSSGEYIVFVDPDDWLPADSIDVLHSNMSEDIDLVVGSRIIHKGNEQIKVPLHPQTLSRDEYLNLLLALETPMVPWGKIYRRSLFDKDSFPNVKMTQDLLMNIEISIRLRGVKIVNSLVYNYLSRIDSTCLKNRRTFDNEKELCMIIQKTLIKNNVYNQFKTSYFKGVLALMFSTINSKNSVNTKSTLVLNTYNELRKVRLSKKQLIKLYAIRFKSFKFIVRKLISLKLLIKNIL